jgi:hypothetical protein
LAANGPTVLTAVDIQAWSTGGIIISRVKKAWNKKCHFAYHRFQCTVLTAVDIEAWSIGGIIIRKGKKAWNKKCHFVYHRFHMKYPGTEPGPP